MKGIFQFPTAWFSRLGENQILTSYEWQRQSVFDKQTANFEKENQSMGKSDKPYLYQ